MTEDVLINRVKKKITEFKKGGSDKIADAHDRVSFNVRAKYLERWMEISGADSPEGIDYNEPHIAIEFLLCDPVNLKLIRSKNIKDRQRVYDLMTSEQLDIYFNEVDEHGARYCDLEKVSLVKSIKPKKH